MWKPPERIRWHSSLGTIPDVKEIESSVLFSPIEFGRLKLRNRTWVPAMVPWRATEDGQVTDEVLEWYGRFAKGKPAAIVIEATGIRDISSGPLLRIGHDRYLPDKAIDIIDEAGSLVRLKQGSKRKTVNPQDIEKVVASITRIPIEKMTSSDKEQLKDLEKQLKLQVFGQDDAIRILTQAIKRSRAGLRGAEQPIGSFLFTGPTGVGKTELAKQLAFIMGVHFQRFDMSEYMEKHTVSRLIGAPPGYVGFDQGGLLTDAVRKNPHCVVLLDEIEKAHPDIFNILLQVMDHATLTDNNGREADFRNVVLIMTSNVGAKDMSSSVIGFGSGMPKSPSKQALEKTFSPEFRNRLDNIVPFAGLPEKVVLMVVDKLLVGLEVKLQPQKVVVSVSDPARNWLAKKGYDPMFGARPMARTIQQEIETVLADEVLFGKLQQGGQVNISLKNNKLHFKYV